MFENLSKKILRNQSLKKLICTKKFFEKVLKDEYDADDDADDDAARASVV